jgi:hypothetical protein
MTKYAGRGITIEIDGVPAGQLRDFAPVGSSRALIDASAYGDDWADYVTGLQDGDSVAYTFAYDPADSGHTAFVESYNAGSEITLHLEHEESGFDVYVTALIESLARGGALDGLLEMSGNIKIREPGVVDAS